MKTAAILLAGGVGTRMKSEIPKQFLALNGKPLALYSFEVLACHPAIHEIVVVCDPKYQFLFDGAVFALPGERRQDSVYNGLQEVSKECDLVCIHDAARPFINAEIVQNVIDEAFFHGAACAAVPMKSTVKQSYADQFVFQTLDRNCLWEIQTPQVIQKEILEEGFRQAKTQNLSVTDDVSLVELQNKKVKLVTAIYENIKVTTQDDLIVAEQLMGR